MLAAAALAWLYLLFFVFTDLEGSVSTVVLMAGCLLWSMARRERRAMPQRFAFASLLLLQVMIVFQDLILRRDWPASRLDAFWTLKHWMCVPILGCVAVAAVLSIRAASARKEPPAVAERRPTSESPHQLG